MGTIIIIYPRVVVRMCSVIELIPIFIFFFFGLPVTYGILEPGIRSELHAVETQDAAAEMLDP